MKKKKYLFYLNTFNDTDHLVPIIYKFLEKKEKVEVIYLSKFNYKEDYRIKFLLNYKNLSISKASKLMYLKNKIFSNRFISKFRSLCPDIINKNISYIISPELKNVACVIYEWGAPNRLNHFNTKTLLIPSICLPHGLSIFKNYDFNEHVKKIKKETGRWPDHSDRNLFDIYVFQSDRHRKMACDWGQDPKKTFVWGSARFDPKWAKINLDLMQPFNPIVPYKNMFKIIFILPHWSYNVDYKKTIECISKIVADKSIFLIIKGHTRGTGSLNKNKIYNLKKKKNIVFDTSAHSPALISWSDTVINFGSSIGIEAIIQNKLLINPCFLHKNRTIFDKESLVNTVNTIDEMIILIKKFRKKNIKLNNKISNLMFRDVYANTKK